MRRALGRSGDDETVLAVVLSNTRRRYIVRILREADAPLALADLARELLGREQEGPESAIDHEHVRRCQIRLYHTHVPCLADAGLVTFDSDRRTVTLTESAPPVPMDSPANGPELHQ